MSLLEKIKGKIGGALGLSEIDAFMGAAKGGLAKPNRYMVVFLLPLMLVDLGGKDVAPDVNILSMLDGTIRINWKNRVGIMCHTCTMPGRSLNTFEVKNAHLGVKHPSGQSYDQMSFTFYADTAMEIRNFFELWQVAAVNRESNTFNFQDEYTATVLIAQLDQYGSPSYGVTLTDAYVTSVSSTDLSYSSNNALSNVNVTMSYRHWTSSNPALLISSLFS
jgi:hypothetical protein